MISDSPDDQESPDHKSVESNTDHQPKPADVPVFNCIVYVSTDSGGGVRARVANLPELDCTAANEREALMKIVPAFKKCVSQWTEDKTPIPWIEPPSPAESGEEIRYIPVHL